MSDFFLLWIVIAVLAAIGEVLTTGLFLGIIATAAIITAFATLALPPTEGVVAFIGFSLLGLLVVRPIIVSVIGRDALVNDSGRYIDTHLIGRRAVVTRAVGPEGGQIRVGEGEFWSARPYDATTRIPVGAPVEIMLIDSLTALVAPVAALESEGPVSEKGIQVQ